MGKKSSQSSPMKASKNEKRPQINSLMKILKPKVYITDTCNFKRLVQELTGNGQYPPLDSSPPASSIPLSQPSLEVPFVDEINYPDLYQHNLVCQDNTWFGSSSPDLSQSTAFSNSVMGESEKMEFYKGLESMLMDMASEPSDYDNACYDQMFLQQDQACVYDYDLSNFV